MPVLADAIIDLDRRFGAATVDVIGFAGVEVIDLSDLSSEGPASHLCHICSRAVGEVLRQLLTEASWSLRAVVYNRKKAIRDLRSKEEDRTSS